MTRTEDSRQALLDLEDAIHTLAQPMTALLFVVEIAAMRTSPEEMREGLATARTECRRAVAALQQVREASARLAEGEAQ